MNGDCAHPQAYRHSRHFGRPPNRSRITHRTGHSTRPGGHAWPRRAEWALASWNRTGRSTPVTGAWVGARDRSRAQTWDGLHRPSNVESCSGSIQTAVGSLSRGRERGHPELPYLRHDMLQSVLEVTAVSWFSVEPERGSVVRKKRGTRATRTRTRRCRCRTGGRLDRLMRVIAGVNPGQVLELAARPARTQDKKPPVPGQQHDAGERGPIRSGFRASRRCWLIRNRGPNLGPRSVSHRNHVAFSPPDLSLRRMIHQSGPKVPPMVLSLSRSLGEASLGRSLCGKLPDPL